MTSALAAELSRLTPREKIALADWLLNQAGAHERPTSILAADDSSLAAELNRRITDRSPGAWLTLEEFRAQTQSSRAPTQTSSPRRD